jgi:hypothetical protein
MPTLFHTAYDEMRNGLASSGFSTDKEWSKVVDRARKFMAGDGFVVSEASLTDDLRKKLVKSNASGTKEAVCIFECAGSKPSGAAVVDPDLAKRLAALKTIRHTYLLKKFGGHKVWIVSIPPSFTEWPHLDLCAPRAAAVTKLDDTTERFADEDRKNLGNASQEGLKWVHKAMVVASSPKKSSNFELIARWFADGNSTDADVFAMATTLNTGLKKIAAALKSGGLIYTDGVTFRGTTEMIGTEAFAWADSLDVVYIESEFFGTSNTLTGLTNWARIVIHELTHRKLDTDDHAYEHQGMNPKKIGAARAIDNADSWAWFCADCAGMLTRGQVDNALAR